MSIYKTVKNVSEGTYKEKGSKFLSFIFPCLSEEESKKLLIQLRKQHPLAVHVCYAFRIGSEKKHFRSSDDGEPSNSAGPPILGQIQSFDLTNVLVAVVRYYGGTNLGVGGLIQAYRTSTRDAIENATIIEDEDRIEIGVSFTYEQMPTIMRIVKNNSCMVLEQELNQLCFLKLRIAKSNNSLINELEKNAQIRYSE